MKYLPDGNQMKQADAETIQGKKVPSMVLMERAALKCVERMEKEKVDLSRVLVVCGSGNNGGDGYAIARLLHLSGHAVDVVLAGKEASMSEETKAQREILKNYGVEDLKEIPGKTYTAVVDAVFGIGLGRNVEGHYKEILEKMNAQSGTKIAVDIPSGVSSYTGEVLGSAFRADFTVTFACTKLGMVLYPGKEYCGRIFTEDIGIQTDLFDGQAEVAYTYEGEDVKERMPKRTANSHKGTYGKVLMITGSRGMAGAAYLSAKAALTAGCGLVKIYTEENNRAVLQSLLPEAIVSTYEAYDEKQLERELAWADAVAIGCGLGTLETAERILSYVCRHAEIPLVVDADALNLLAEDEKLISVLCRTERRKEKKGLIFTPHVKEMSRLLGCGVKEIVPFSERKKRLTAFTGKYPGLVCALKDARTLVSEQERPLYINTSGSQAMAKGGSGDVLAGVIVSLLAQHMRPYEAAVLGVYLHGLAGEQAGREKGDYSVLAEDVIRGISQVLKSIKEYK